MRLISSPESQSFPPTTNTILSYRSWQSVSFLCASAIFPPDIDLTVVLSCCSESKSHTMELPRVLEVSLVDRLGGDDAAVAISWSCAACRYSSLFSSASTSHWPVLFLRSSTRSWLVLWDPMSLWTLSCSNLGATSSLLISCSILWHWWSKSVCTRHRWCPTDADQHSAGGAIWQSESIAPCQL